MEGPAKDYRRLRNLMELKITDCEGLTPIKFRNLPHLQYLTLHRCDKSNNNTIGLGQRWIADLSSPVLCPSLSLQCTLKQLTLRGTSLTNNDLGRMLCYMVPKLPNLETLIIDDNFEIDSFKEVIDTIRIINKRDATTATDAATCMQRKLRTLKVSDSMIDPTSLEELDSMIYFLKHLYPTIGVLKVFSYDGVSIENTDDGQRCQRSIELLKEQADKLHKIEYLLSMNSTNAFTMTNSRPSSSLASSLIPSSVWPLAIAKAYRKKYQTCYQESYLRDETNFRQNTRYDVVYHLLRHGSIFAAGQTCRYKRKREHYSRGAKYRGAEKSNKN